MHQVGNQLRSYYYDAARSTKHQNRHENVTNMCDCVSFSAVSGDYGPHEVQSYQLTRMGSGQPRSETSDEWVDVEITDSEGEGGEDAVAG